MMKPPRIESVYAFISVDPVDGIESVCAAPVDGLTLPMMAADEARLNLLIPIAEQVTAITRMKIKLVKFTRREEIRSFE